LRGIKRSQSKLHAARPSCYRTDMHQWRRD
jgi:hypothetical protein